MKTVTIRLTMMTDHVKNFVSLVNRYPYDMDLRSGRYVVDAKSILGVCALGTKKALELKMVNPKGEEQQLLTALSQYLVEKGTDG